MQRKIVKKLFYLYYSIEVHFIDQKQKEKRKNKICKYFN
jgi:hypothetical protein